MMNKQILEDFNHWVALHARYLSHETPVLRTDEEDDDIEIIECVVTYAPDEDIEGGRRREEYTIQYVELEGRFTFDCYFSEEA